jgi:hypothetical protein
MQRKTKKIFDVLRIVINVILLLFMILCLITNKESYYAIYWIIVPIMLVCETFYLYKWTKIDEWNVDKKDSKAIRYSFDGLTTGTLVLSGLLYLVVMALEMFQKSIKTNIYVLVIVYILFTISILCNIMAVNSANRESKELAEKTFKYKK